MQRSEVLRIIANYGLSIELAEALLDDLEFVGMLPPHLHTAKLHGYIWEPEIKEELYGKSAFEEVNADIKALNKIVDSSEENE